MNRTHACDCYSDSTALFSVFFCREKMCALVEIEMSFIYCLFVCFSSWWTRFAPNLTEKRENEKIKLKRLTREKNNNRNIEIERCLCLKWFWSWFREKLYGIELLVLSWIWLNWWWRWSVDEKWNGNRIGSRVLMLSENGLFTIF